MDPHRQTFVNKKTKYKRKKPLAFDLFSGCGGLTLGLKQAGFKVLGAIEKDDLAVKTYRANHPNVNVWHQDIRKVSTNEVLATFGLKSGELDLLAGCPPCQGFSSMTTLNGNRIVEDDRNDLIFEYLRFVKALRPKAVMLENVPGLFRDDRFKRLRASLRGMGYCVNAAIEDAQNYGVPQRRRRLIVIAGMNLKISFAKKQLNRPTVREAIGKLPRAGKSGDPVHDLKECRTPEILKKIALIPKDGGSRSDLPFRKQLKCHRKCSGFKDVYGRMAWDKVAPTITSGCFNPSKGRFLHPKENRAITMREAAMLQTFPRNYRFPDCTSKSAIALMIGNALPPEFIKRQAKQILLCCRQTFYADTSDRRRSSQRANGRPIQRRN